MCVGFGGVLWFQSSARDFQTTKREKQRSAEETGERGVAERWVPLVFIVCGPVGEITRRYAVCHSAAAFGTVDSYLFVSENCLPSWVTRIAPTGPCCESGAAPLPFFFFSFSFFFFFSFFKSETITNYIC
jgi:hypothetical protein